MTRRPDDVDSKQEAQPELELLARQDQAHSIEVTENLDNWYPEDAIVEVW